MTATMVERAVVVRDARADDNAALLELAAACSMEGDIALAVSRVPDFFALNRLEGSEWRCGVAEVDGRIVGCIMGAVRIAYLHRRPTRTLYSGDLKVHPSWRGAGIADALTQWVVDALADLGGPDAPVLVTILGGNRAMERRTGGRGGAAAFARFATIRAFSIPLVWPRFYSTAALDVAPATHADVDEMAALWRRVAPSRHFAPVLDADDLRAWITSAPGLDISDYRVARNSDGRIVGFLALWDQSSFKQSRVLRYSPRLAVVKAAINGFARVTRGTQLPSVGEPLRYRTALHVCVPAEQPDTLKALLRSSCVELRAQRYAFATIGLDVRDPLCAALDGLGAQPTDVNAYVLTPGGPYCGAPLNDRPLHYEIALV